MEVTRPAMVVFTISMGCCEWLNWISILKHVSGAWAERERIGSRAGAVEISAHRVHNSFYYPRSPLRFRSTIVHLWPWIWGALYARGWTIFLPILVFLGRFVLDLSANTCQTHHVTLRLWPLSLMVPALVDGRWCGPSCFEFDLCSILSLHSLIYCYSLQKTLNSLVRLHPNEMLIVWELICSC